MQLARHMALLPIDSQLSPGYLHNAGAEQGNGRGEMEYNPQLKQAAWDRDWSQPRGDRGGSGGPGGGKRDPGQPGTAPERGGGVSRPNRGWNARNWRQQPQQPA